MRHRFLLPACALALSLAPMAASAAGISLRWTNCTADGGTSNVAFSCATNSGVFAMVPSFVLDAPMSGPTSIVGVVDLVAAAPALPAWWDLTGCRSGALTLLSSAVGPVLCSPWRTFGSAGINSIVNGSQGPNTARITFTVTSSAPRPDLAGGVEYIVTALRLNVNRTVGSPSCTGCGTGVCLALPSLSLVTRSGTIALTEPFAGPGGDWVTWQGGGSGPAGSCEATSRPRRSTWGKIRTLYR